MPERTPCMQDVRSGKKECPKLSDFGDFFRNESIDEYQVMVSCITASFTGYPLEDAVSAGVNTRIVVLTPCMKNFDVAYRTSKSLFLCITSPPSTDASRANEQEKHGERSALTGKEFAELRVGSPAGSVVPGVVLRTAGFRIDLVVVISIEHDCLHALSLAGNAGNQSDAHKKME